MNEIKMLSKSQRGFLMEIKRRHNEAFNVELNRAISDIVEELGVAADVKAGKVNLQLAKDYSVVTIIPIEKPSAPPAPAARIPKKPKK